MHSTFRRHAAALAGSLGACALLAACSGPGPSSAPRAATPSSSQRAKPAASAPSAASSPACCVTGGTTVPNGKPYDATFFQHAGTNPFVDTQDEHLSTFGMDVDTASYGIMRRYLADGHLPEPDSVRVEEFVNSFTYHYPPPSA